MNNKPQTLWSQSGVNAKGEPFVQLTLEGNVIAQFTPSECRDFAHVLIEASEASETDAFMMQFVQKKLGVGRDHAGAVLIELRKFREEYTGKKYGAQSRTDWVFPHDPGKVPQ